MKGNALALAALKARKGEKGAALHSASKLPVAAPAPAVPAPSSAPVEITQSVTYRFAPSSPLMTALRISDPKRRRRPPQKNFPEKKILDELARDKPALQAASGK